MADGVVTNGDEMEHGASAHLSNNPQPPMSWVEAIPQAISTPADL